MARSSSPPALSKWRPIASGRSRRPFRRRTHRPQTRSFSVLPAELTVFSSTATTSVLNVSCLPDGEAGGILFRALEPLSGIEEMAKLRGIVIDGRRDLRNLTSGPGRLAPKPWHHSSPQQRKESHRFPASDLYIAGDGSPRPKVISTIRIGITKAADLPLRYLIPGNVFVSGPRHLDAR